MEIKPSEVESVKIIGSLHGDDVKLIKTVGGFFCAVGKKSKHKKTVEPLAAGSHSALVSHQIEKEYKSEYKPMIMKSEHDAQPKVEEFTKKLPQEMVDKGYQLYSLTKAEKVNFIATRVGLEVVNLGANVTADGFDAFVNEGKKTSGPEINKICSTIAEIINEHY